MSGCFGGKKPKTKVLAQKLIDFQKSLEELKDILQNNQAGASGWNVQDPPLSQESGLVRTENLLESFSEIMELLPKNVIKEINKIETNRSNASMQDRSSSPSQSRKHEVRPMPDAECEVEDNSPKANKRKRVGHGDKEEVRVTNETSNDQQKQNSKKPKKKKRIVQLCYQKSNILDKVASELKKMLKNKFPGVDVLERKSVEDIQKDTPGILLCINASRLGTDVSGAIKGLQYHQNTAVIVLHHKLEHALPSVPSEKLLIGVEYQNLKLITDIAFNSDEGIYPCEMNDRGFEQLTEFIKSNSPEG